MTLPTKMLLSFVAGLVLLFAFGGTPAGATDEPTTTVEIIVIPDPTIPQVPGPSPECPDGEYPQGYGPDVPCGPEDPCIDIDPETGLGTTLWTIQDCRLPAYPPQTTPTTSPTSSSTTTVPDVTTTTVPTLPETGSAATTTAAIAGFTVGAGLAIWLLARRRGVPA